MARRGRGGNRRGNPAPVSVDPPPAAVPPAPLNVGSVSPAADSGDGEVAPEATESSSIPHAVAPQEAEALPSIDSPPAPPAPDVPLPIAPPGLDEQPPIDPLLFEIAWEVCWQLGGIYTVLRTKAEAMLRRWGERYCLIGPYNPATAVVEFEERPAEGVLAEAIAALRRQGVAAYHGRWLIAGRPRVILLDYRARYSSLDVDKYLLWKDHGISTIAGDGEVNEVAAFGFTVTEFFRELMAASARAGQPDRPVVAHFHEWMAGVAVPRIAHLRIPVSTVFTTHATLLGRYLASDSPEFYNHLPFINAEAEAAKYNIQPRHAIERAAAHASTVFTTVSEVTATEAERLLGRAPDAILPNGLNIQRFAALHEFQNLHLENKERIHEFVMGHFFPAYTFDLDRTLYLFTSGRYEYRNKGMDLFVEALYRLNQRLRGMSDPPTIVAFIITKAAVRNVNVGVLEAQSRFEDLEELCARLQQQIGARVFRAAAHGRPPMASELLDEDGLVRLKQAIHAWRTGRQPAIVTHDLADDAGDPVLQHLRYRGLFNAPSDPVKVVFHPQFVTATSPLISLDYEQFVRGCHMGIFPSYYEPWGYTPMESIALGVPAVTTDLSGFGAYVERHVPGYEEQGVFVLNRRTHGFDAAANDMVELLMRFIGLTRRQRIEQRNRVERLSELFDWSNLARHYDEAHSLALERIGAKRPGTLDVRVV